MKQKMSIINKKITKGRAKQNFFCENELNNQIKMELEAANTYLSLVRLKRFIFDFK